MLHVLSSLLKKWCYLPPQDDFLGKLVSLSTQPEHESFVLDARHDSIVVRKCCFAAIVYHYSSWKETMKRDNRVVTRYTGSGIKGLKWAGMRDLSQ